MIQCDYELTPEEEARMELQSDLNATRWPIEDEGYLEALEEAEMNTSTKPGRIVSNLRIAAEEMRAQGADLGWQKSCEEAARVLTLVETRMALLARTSSEPAQSAATYMRKFIRDGFSDGEIHEEEAEAVLTNGRLAVLIEYADLGRLGDANLGMSEQTAAFKELRQWRSK